VPVKITFRVPKSKKKDAEENSALRNLNSLRAVIAIGDAITQLVKFIVLHDTVEYSIQQARTVSHPTLHFLGFCHQYRLDVSVIY